MKKNVKNILIFISFLGLIGCSKQKEENVKEKDIFNIKSSQQVVETYFEDIENEKYDNVNELLDDKIKTDIKKIKANDLKIKGYRIEKMGESAGKGNFTVSVVKSNINKLESQILQYRIEVERYGVDYKISKIDIGEMGEIFQSLDQIRIKKENEVNTLLITDKEGIPKYAYPKDDKGKIKSQLVPKKTYAMGVLDYTGDMFALSTFDKNSYIGIVNFEDAMQTQGEEEQGTGGEEKSKEKAVKEKPIGKSIVSCDIIEDSIIENMIFSKGEKLLAVQYKKGDNRCIRIYNTGSGELISVKFEEEYPLSKVEVVFKNFEDEKINYSVIPKNEQEKNNQYVGEWELDLKAFKISKAKK